MWKLRALKKFPFGGLYKNKEETKISLIGAPLDLTNSHAPGTYLAPEAIRRIAESLEWYSLLYEGDFSENGIYDEGDLVLFPGKVRENIDLISESLLDIKEEKRIPFMLGGEHTVTLASSKLLDEDTLLVVFDAHFDLRDEYLNSNITHATVMRRIVDNFEPKNLLFIGTRAVSQEELDFVKKNQIEYITSRRIWLYGISEFARNIERKLEKFGKIYVSIDIDAVDPGYAPGVSTPEPLGIDPHMFFGLLDPLVNEKLIGLDIVEVNPIRDAGEATSALAAKIVIESAIKLNKIYNKR
ncbi:agmatinase [Fervidicoccus fontis]|jgi:agmatinase|uniref:Agmatinase (Agmatine ureohydrolase) (SpeB-1) n=2 Tax=Fervidicoccus fontis TaxID=683846 RepID=H9ZZN5_FERFK|nr:agmatinase [Fervidicoccus fontis]AFH42192.1 Agmatinase (agmatine ureohydrolase) (speB-1) [Fervidicoccus fontis Kam940]MBE9390944.1 agmatinase [Fervidicoccus fontis]PMB76020.1 MAG: agmatinase [Fervidicoccus fontis]HEW64309.1 agmatinase [Fervidicoccus fontis]